MTSLVLASMLVGITATGSPAAAPAVQGTSTRQLLPNTVVLDLPYGKVAIYLPNDIRGGDRISGSVFAQPKGDNWNAQHQNLQYLEACKLEAGNVSLPIGHTMFSLDIPVTASALPLVVDDPQGRPLGKISIDLASRNSIRPGGIAIPSIVQAGMPIGISGSFDGDRSNTFIRLNGRPAGILAEGRRECYVTSPVDRNGTVAVNVSEGGLEAERRVNVVGFTFMTPAKPLRAGSRSSIGVEVDGLQNATEESFPITVRLMNDSPKVMRFDGPDASVYFLEIKKTDVVRGHVLKAVPIIAKSRGSYNITGGITGSGR